MSVTGWLLNKTKGVNYQRMLKTIDIISKENHKSKLLIFFDMVYCFFTRGCGYTDYYRGNYIQLTKKEKDTFVCAKSFYKIIHYLNDKEYQVILHDKIVFNTYFSSYIHRKWLDLRNHSLEEFKEFLKDQKVVFAKKPIGEGGKGISKIIVGEWQTENLYEELKKRGQFLVEEAIKQAEEVNQINPNVVNSFRIITIYKEGKVFIVNNAFRVNQDAKEIIGCTNDVYFHLNEEGKIDSNVIDDFGTIYKEHPLTHKKFCEVEIKGVKEAYNLVAQLHKQIPQVRYIGWDVAFTKERS